ncbi:MAG TPA: hypothetical protein VHK88_01860 [Aquihabitans sp.]|nr:hypothetical protein [Aquihabitans sp.]
MTAPSRPAGSFDRRTLVLSALVLAVVIVGGVAIVALTSDGGDQRANEVQEGEIPPAEAIPQPGRGRAPERPGDRGGWEQLAILGVIVIAVTGIGLVIFRGGRRARADRARWLAAGRSGRDGALDDASP